MMLKTLEYDFSRYIEGSVALKMYTVEGKKKKNEIEYSPSHSQMRHDIKENLDGEVLEYMPDTEIKYKYRADDGSLASVTVRYKDLMNGDYDGMQGESKMRTLVEECPLGYRPFLDILTDIKEGR